jgi:hypothetical protein
VEAGFHPDAPQPLPEMQKRINAIRDPEIRTRVQMLLQSGHGIQRHVVTEKQHNDRVLLGNDPASGTNIDAINTTQTYQTLGASTGFRTLEDYVLFADRFSQSDKYLTFEKEIREAFRLLGSTPSGQPLVDISVPVPLSNLLKGRNPNSYFFGVKAVSTEAHAKIIRNVDFSGGYMQFSLVSEVWNGELIIRIDTMFLLAKKGK